MLHTNPTTTGVSLVKPTGRIGVGRVGIITREFTQITIFTADTNKLVLVAWLFTLLLDISNLRFLLPPASADDSRLAGADAGKD